MDILKVNINSKCGWAFCFNFLNDKVNSEQSTPIGYNVMQLNELADYTSKLN
jgi:hypothetical protein